MSTMGRKKNEILVGAFNALNEYYTEEKDFQIIAASGVDFILMAYLHDEKSDYNISMLEKYGIKAFIYDVTLNTSDPATLTDETVLKLSAPYRHSPSFLGFGIIDEPAEEIFPRLGAEVRAIRHAIPDALFHINLLPWYAFNDTDVFRSHLRKFAETVEINHISTDDYPLWQQEDGSLTTNASYYTGLNTSAQIASAFGREHWLYIDTFSRVSERGYRVHSREDLYFQAYSGLTFGACKILYFVFDITGYHGVPKEIPGAPYGMRDYARGVTELYGYGKELADRLHALSDVYSRYSWKHTEAVFCNGKNEEFLKGIPAYTENRIVVEQTNTGLAVGSFDETDGDGFAFMVMNASEVSENITSNVTFRVPDAATLTAHIGNTSVRLLPDSEGLYRMAIAPGMAIFLTGTK